MAGSHFSGRLAHGCGIMTRFDTRFQNRLRVPEIYTGKHIALTRSNSVSALKNSFLPFYPGRPYKGFVHMNTNDPLKKTLSGLYGITCPSLMNDDKTLLNSVEQAILGGMSLLQYRNKRPDSSKQALRQSRLLRTLCSHHNIPFIINDSVRLAYDVGADGVHIGQNDTALNEAREMLGAEAIIGVTCHGSLEYAHQAEEQGASYVAFGCFFNSLSKPEAALTSFSVLQQARKDCTVPIVAIGGIKLDNVREVIAAGADMFAVIHGLFGASDIRERAKAFSVMTH